MDGNLGSDDDQILVKGNYSIAPNVSGEIEIDTWEIKKLGFKYVISNTIGLSVTYNAELLSWKKEIPLARIWFQPIIVFIGPAPIVIRPVIVLLAGIDFSVKTTLKTGITQNLDYTFEMNYSEGQWNTAQEIQKTFNYQEPEINSNAAAQVYIKPQINLRFYGIVAPNISATVYGQIEADTKQDPWWKLFAGFKMDAGVKMKVFSKTIIDYNKNFFDFKEIIAQATDTLKELPTVTTTDITAITDSSAMCGGEVTEENSTTVISRGICWDTNSNPDLNKNHTSEGSGLGLFISNITGLLPNKEYFVKAYATNSTGTAYGEEKSFITKDRLPKIETLNITDIYDSTAYVNYKVIDDGGTDIIARGVCWDTISNPDLNKNHTSDVPGLGIFSSKLTGLRPNKEYFVRAYATNNKGTAYGEEKSFVTRCRGPTITTSNVINITLKTAQCGGNVIDDGGLPILSRGVCWTSQLTHPNPLTTFIDSTIDGSGTGEFISYITGLIPNTTYLIRAYAINAKGKAYGDIQTFTTCMGKFIDSRDDHEYMYTVIGSQTWMAENLAYIPHVNPHDEHGGIWVLFYDGSNVSEAISHEHYLYAGCLYDWSTAMTACPPGWHLPSLSDVEILAQYISNIKGPYERFESWPGIGWQDVGKHLVTMAHQEDDCDGTDDFGFSALGSGHWWLSTGWEEDNELAWMFFVSCPLNTGMYFIPYQKLNLNIKPIDNGRSIRCIKN